MAKKKDVIQEEAQAPAEEPKAPLFTIPGVTVLPRPAAKRLRKEFDLTPQDVVFVINDSNVVEVYRK